VHDVEAPVRPGPSTASGRGIAPCENEPVQPMRTVNTDSFIRRARQRHDHVRVKQDSSKGKASLISFSAINAMILAPAIMNRTLVVGRFSGGGRRSDRVSN